MRLAAEGLSRIVDGQHLVHRVDLAVMPGGLTVILGPNGSGKTTLLHLLAGLTRPSEGRVLLDGRDLHSLRPRERARRIALVEQHPSTTLDLTVRQVVAFGRIPHRGRWPGATDRDAEAIDDAMITAEVDHLAGRRWGSLSGGERQRVHLARALAQRPEVLLLDEPTNHLDLKHQLSFLATVRDLPTTTVAVLHDLDLAAAFGEWVAVLDRGRLAAHGPMEATLDDDLIGAVFGVRAAVSRSDRLRVLWEFPLGAHARRVGAGEPRTG